MENNFVHLNLHTEYSLSEGVNSIDNFLIKAKELGMDSLAVTDYANMFCAVEFYQKAKKMGIKPIIGLELPISNRDEQNIFSLTLLAKNYNGYKNLVKLASELYKKNENRELKINKEIYNAGIRQTDIKIRMQSEPKTCFNIYGGRQQAPCKSTFRKPRIYKLS